MAITVEDGTGLSDANSYLSVSDADAYWADRANATSPGGIAWSSASEKEGALIEASQYLDSTYSWVWNNPPHYISELSGVYYSPYPTVYVPLKETTQGLLWPRVNAYDAQTKVWQDGVPQKVKDATVELALIALDGALLTVQGRKTKRESVGSIEVEYMDASSPYDTYPHVDRILTGLYRYSRNGGSRKLERA